MRLRRRRITIDLGRRHHGTRDLKDLLDAEGLRYKLRHSRLPSPDGSSRVWFTIATSAAGTAAYEATKAAVQRALAKYRAAHPRDRIEVRGLDDILPDKRDHG